MEKLENDMSLALFNIGKKKFLAEKASDMTEGEIGILFYLYHSNSCNLNPKKLTERMNISKSMVTGILNLLEKKGYIIKKTDDIDKRKITIFLTTKGISFIKSEDEKIHNQIKKMIQKIGTEDTKKFIEIINKLTVEDEND